MKMRELNTYLKEAITSLGEVIVRQDFIDSRNCLVNQYAKGNRSIERRIMDADCTLLEYTLIQRQLVEKPYNILHDFCIQEYRIDLKCINSNWFVPKAYNIPWMLEGIQKNNLTHFLFYNMIRPHRPLKMDDEIKFKFVKTEYAANVLRNLKVSKFDGYYYQVKG